MGFIGESYKQKYPSAQSLELIPSLGMVYSPEGPYAFLLSIHLKGKWNREHLGDYVMMKFPLWGEK